MDQEVQYLEENGKYIKRVYVYSDAYREGHPQSVSQQEISKTEFEAGQALPQSIEINLFNFVKEKYFDYRQEIAAWRKSDSINAIWINDLLAKEKLVATKQDLVKLEIIINEESTNLLSEDLKTKLLTDIGELKSKLSE